MIEEKEHYQRITGHARAATLSGKFFSSCVSQILAIVFSGPPFNLLVYLSIFGKTIFIMLFNTFVFSQNKFLILNKKKYFKTKYLFQLKNHSRSLKLVFKELKIYLFYNYIYNTSRKVLTSSVTFYLDCMLCYLS